MDHIDKSLAELDSMESWLSLYAAELNVVYMLYIAEHTTNTSAHRVWEMIYVKSKYKIEHFKY